MAAVVPVLLVTTAWLIIYHVLGYGTHGSGTYIDPLGHPAKYLAVLPARWRAAIGTLFLGTPSDLR